MKREFFKMKSIKDRVSEILLDISAVMVAPEEGPYFEYSAKPLQGQTYADCRVIISHDDEKEEIAQLMKRKLVINEQYDVVLGSTTAGMSPAENLSRVLGNETHYYYVRTDEKAYGLGQRIEGDKELLKEIAKEKECLDIIIAEDLINSGRSCKIVWNAFKEWCEDKNIKLRTKKITCIVSYGNKGFDEWVNQEGFEFKPLVYLPYIFKFGEKNNMISEKQYELAIEFLKDQARWREERGLPTKPY